MSFLGVVLLVPRILLHTAEVPAPLQETAVACTAALADALGPDAVVLAPTVEEDLTARVQSDLDAAAESYRQLRFREAATRLARAVDLLASEARSAADFETLFTARVRLGMAELALHHPGPARERFTQAARTGGSERLSEEDYSPAIIAAFEEARAALPAGSELVVEARPMIAHVPVRVLIDGVEAVSGARVVVRPGDHVLYATAPGHDPVRQVVTTPRAEPVRVALASPAAADRAGMVVGVRVEVTPGGVRLRVELIGRPPLTADSDRAGAPAAARSLAPRLRSALAPGAASATLDVPLVPPANANAHTQGSAPASPPHETPSGSVFGRWWFWTIVGGVAVITVVGVAAANRRDAGTDVRVGLQ